MEQPLSSLTFKGSIVEAIVEAKIQRKLFVVYISGDDAESSNLESSTWSNSKVAESLSKYCVLLHIPAGSADADQFSAIYPQKTVPCITAIGYNGIQLWQNEGFVSAEVLASNLEKAWLSLHIQETTASVLTAALTSENSELSTSRPSNSSASDFRSSSSATVPPPDHHVNFSQTNLGVKNEKTEEEKEPAELVKHEDTKSVDEESGVQHATSVGNDESPDSSVEDKSSFMATVDQQSGSIEHASNASSTPSKLTESCQSGDSVAVSLEAKEAKQEKSEIVDDTKASKNDRGPKDYTSSDVHLNIRLLNGLNLQEKFSMTSTLRVVKDFVDNNQKSVSGSYDLAISYPRQVFTDHDLDKSLSDLGLSNRQALIVVRRLGMSSDFRGTSSSFDQRTSADGISSNENGDGYFAFIKRMLSFVNPLSYLGGGASSASSRPEIGGTRQYGSNTTARHGSSEAARPTHPLENQQTPTADGNNTRNRQPSTTRFGANIHTLKHDEDDERFRGRNSFWNGNSTQYGGDNDGK